MSLVNKMTCCPTYKATCLVFAQAQLSINQCLAKRKKSQEVQTQAWFISRHAANLSQDMTVKHAFA